MLIGAKLDYHDRQVVSSAAMPSFSLTGILSSYKCAVSQDGSKLVVGKEGEGFHLYSRDTAAQIGQFRVPPESSGGCMSVYFAHKDLFLVGGSQTGEVRVWDIGSGDRIQTLKGAVGDVIDIAVRLHTSWPKSRDHLTTFSRHTTDLRTTKTKTSL